MCQASQRPPSVSTQSQPAMSIGENHTGREKVIPKTKYVVPCSRSPWKWELHLGSGDGLAGRAPASVSERLGFMAPATQWTTACLFIARHLSFWTICWLNNTNWRRTHKHVQNTVCLPIYPSIYLSYLRNPLSAQHTIYHCCHDLLWHIQIPFGTTHQLTTPDTQQACWHLWLCSYSHDLLYFYQVSE